MTSCSYSRARADMSPALNAAALSAYRFLIATRSSVMNLFASRGSGTIDGSAATQQLQKVGNTSRP